MKNLIVGQSGGPTAVINSSLYGVIREGFNRSEEIEHVYGMTNGIQGYDSLIRESASALCTYLNSTAKKLENLQGTYETYLDQDIQKVNDILKNIQDGSFAKEFLLDMSEAGGQAHFRAMRKLASEHPSEKVGEEIRKLYSWNGEDKLINN